MARDRDKRKCVCYAYSLSVKNGIDELKNKGKGIAS
jgi:hypothetical protein